MRTFIRRQQSNQKPKSIDSTKHGRAFSRQNRAVRSILNLQRIVGNQEALRLLQANSEELEADPSTTTSIHSARDFSQIPLHLNTPSKVQPKLTVSTPGDLYEKEADRVADQVMRMPKPHSLRAAYGVDCPKTQGKEPNLDRLQIKSTQETDVESSVGLPIVREVLRSSGQPLDIEMKSFTEPRFGYDFSHVRVHTDAKAAESARSMNALAYTVGKDIVFGSDSYTSGSSIKKRLLAHELAHVIQQERDIMPLEHLQREVLPIPPSPPALVELRDHVERQMLRALQLQLGRAVTTTPQAVTPALIQRADDAIRAQFDTLLPSGRDFTAASSTSIVSPQQMAQNYIPNRARAREIIVNTAFQIDDSLSYPRPTAQQLRREDSHPLVDHVAEPLLAGRGIDFIRQYALTFLGGYTRHGETTPHTVLPSGSRNAGHVILHEAIHYYVNGQYHAVTRSHTDSEILVEGGAELLARFVINNQLHTDPLFDINANTYMEECLAMHRDYSIGTTVSVQAFAMAYFQGRLDLIGLSPPVSSP